MCKKCECLGVCGEHERRVCKYCSGSVESAPIPKHYCPNCGKETLLQVLPKFKESYCAACNHPKEPAHMTYSGRPKALKNLWETIRSEAGSCFPLDDYLRRITPSVSDWKLQEELDFEEAAEDDRMLREFLASRRSKEVARVQGEEIEELVQDAASWERAEKEKETLALVDARLRQCLPRSVPTKQGHWGWKGVIDLEGTDLHERGMQVQLGAVIIWDPASPHETRKEIRFQMPVDKRLSYECMWTARISGVRWGDLCPGYPLMQPGEVVALLRRELAGVELFAKGTDLECAFMQCPLLNGVSVTPLSFSVKDLGCPIAFNEYMIKRVLSGDEVWELRPVGLKRNGQPDASFGYRNLFLSLGGFQKVGVLSVPIHLPHRECEFFMMFVN